MKIESSTLNDLLQNLNEYQKNAILDDSPATLVNARVGSGKTTVLISKIFYLLSQEKITLKMKLRKGLSQFIPMWM